MLNHDGNFSYDSDVRWLAEQARPYYYGIIFLLIFLDLYSLALFYALAALMLIWEVDEVDKIDDELDELSREDSDPGGFRLVNLEIMMDYLENFSVDPYFSNADALFSEFFTDLNQNLLYINDPNFFLFDAEVFDNNKIFDNKKIVKMDNLIDKAVLYRESNYDVLKTKLMEFKAEILSTSNPAIKAKVKARMKKLLQLSDEFDEELLLYKISIESHNTVIWNLYLKMGLYPISEYDFDMAEFSDFNFIIYNEYYYFFFIFAEDLETISDFEI